jgi:hypothetical protein
MIPPVRATTLRELRVSLYKVHLIHISGRIRHREAGQKPAELEQPRVGTQRTLTCDAVAKTAVAVK